MDDVNRQLEVLRHQLDEAFDDLERRLEDAETRASVAEARASVAEARASVSETRTAEAERLAQEAHERVDELLALLESAGGAPAREPAKGTAKKAPKGAAPKPAADLRSALDRLRDPLDAASS